MSENKDQIKDVKEFSSRLSAQIWGHRFTDGQRGPEYVLEFLNVLRGTTYNFESPTYKRYKGAGFREFIFEGVKEGSKRNIATVPVEKKERLKKEMDDPEKVGYIQEFFRNLEVPLYNNNGKKADRSWYARSLYPLHESLLFFELRKKAGANAPDFERNFFARGGELYFLMLKYGTKDNYERRRFICDRFNNLLNQNKSIYHIVDNVQYILEDSNDGDGTPPYLVPNESNKEIPLLPTNDHYLYKNFAIELENLLSIKVDMYEMFQLLTSLISFQLVRYMYDRSKVGEQSKTQFFFDCMDGQLPQILKLSSDTFSQNELMIKQIFDEKFNESFHEIISTNYSDEKLTEWKANIEPKGHELLKLLGVNKLSVAKRKQILSALKKCEDKGDLFTKLYPVVKDMVSDGLKKDQLSIIKILLRDGGLGGFRAGSKYRYFMSDTFLQTLVYMKVLPNHDKEYSEFLQDLYEDYGFIIGVQQAKDSGIYEKSKLNISYFKKNEEALRQKLRQNGLLVEYSDATALIHNPYKSIHTHRSSEEAY
ncbi:hypothetical protein LCL89_09600 [Halobacillus yeomjeoni]|uniref:hypothetical protein n=1 Tax=Halobacillus yeomjeoni TaxID=311194 RepID=UPI001CD6B1AE|nr:hypothetical protein [Halobacillus yeomjeoni]MCA0984299.1 hypothetical protein [Halobacillus yeomjeoni]